MGIYFLVNVLFDISPGIWNGLRTYTKVPVYFKSHGVFPWTVKCAFCGRACNFKPSNRNFHWSKVDGNTSGLRIKCKFTVSERKGTFLDSFGLVQLVRFRLGFVRIGFVRLGLVLLG